MQQTNIDMLPFADFEAASKASLKFLHERLGFGLWMMTRTEGDDWIVLQAEDHGYNVEPGKVFLWSDSFCSRMVVGKGPRVAAKVEDVSVYSKAPIARQVPIGAYIGVPVTREDGSLFGTLCAVDPSPKAPSIDLELPLVELIARQLGTILEADLKAVAQARALEQSQREARVDELTGLLNRRGWDQQIAAEEARAIRYGNPVCVFIIDLDELKAINDRLGHAEGDALLCQAGECLAAAVRDGDVVARLGGDEFAILAIEADQTAADLLFSRVSDALAAQNISASVGKALREPAAGLLDAIKQADAAMYRVKMARRNQRRG